MTNFLNWTVIFFTHTIKLIIKSPETFTLININNLKLYNLLYSHNLTSTYIFEIG